MIHLLIDSCIYRADRKRNKPAFRAVLRLARTGKLQLHVPAYVKGEVVTQQQRDIREQLSKLRGAAEAILRTTAQADLCAHAEDVVRTAGSMHARADGLIAAELQSWMTDARAVEHPVQPEHGPRVAASYFGGQQPFRASKHRDDFPDAFIWETALDLVREHGALAVVSTDGRLYQAADEHEQMEAYETLDEFIEDDDIQNALDDLTPQLVATNIERIKKLLPTMQDHLVHSLGNDIVNELAGKTVKHEAIPEDNHEATIMMVGGPENVAFNFTETDHYGDAEIGIPFTATVECELNYAIYKGDYYSLPDTEDINIGERNEHYFDADQDYTINIEGYITVMIDPSELESDELSDQDLRDLINDADTSTELTSVDVSVPYW